VEAVIERWMAMPEWQWVQRLDRKMDEDEFLQENQAGAIAGRGVGGVAGVAAVVTGILYAGAAAAPAAAAAETAGAAKVAAGGAVAWSYRAGHFAGKKTAEAAVKNCAYAAFTVGRFGGAYAGAGVQSGARWIGAKVREH